MCVAAGLVVDPNTKRLKQLHSSKDLRDTFTSQLITGGVQSGYVFVQLDHADLAITARHCERWAGGDAYRSPLDVGEGEGPDQTGFVRLGIRSP